MMRVGPCMWMMLCSMILSFGPLRAEDKNPCVSEMFEGHSFTYCTARPSDDLRLFWGRGDKPYATFSNVNAALAPEGKELLFAMNAGMFHRDLRPVGLHLERGFERMRIIPNAGPGNFGMLPNGVFCVGPHRVDVIETQEFIKTAPHCRYATQSGPMLVIDGVLHPRFLKNSTSRHYRNGVGVSADGQTAYFVISNRPITFYDFARIFQVKLGLANALFLDGSVSRLHAPDIGRSDFGRSLGPMIGVVVDTGPVATQ